MGNLSSGKSALVHRYLTGTYVQEESPEGERPGLAWALSLATLPPFSPSRCLCMGLKPLVLLSPPVSPPWKLWISSLLGLRALLLSVLGLTVHSVLGGRFKKEIVVDGQSYLLLIDPPVLQGPARRNTTTRKRNPSPRASLQRPLPTNLTV